jgi:hypothetical protein
MVKWWDFYSSDPAGPSPDPEFTIAAQSDGSIALTVKGLERDLALKVFRASTYHLPLVLRYTGADGP